MVTGERTLVFLYCSVDLASFGQGVISCVVIRFLLSLPGCMSIESMLPKRPDTVFGRSNTGKVTLCASSLSSYITTNSYDAYDQKFGRDLLPTNSISELAYFSNYGSYATGNLFTQETSTSSTLSSCLNANDFSLSSYCYLVDRSTVEFDIGSYLF